MARCAESRIARQKTWELSVALPDAHRYEIVERNGGGNNLVIARHPHSWRDVGTPPGQSHPQVSGTYAELAIIVRCATRRPGLSRRLRNSDSSHHGINGKTVVVDDIALRSVKGCTQCSLMSVAPLTFAHSSRLTEAS